MIRVVLEIFTGQYGRVLRAETSIDDVSEPIVVGIVETLRRYPNALSVRLDDTQATVRLKPGCTPEEVDEILDALGPSLRMATAPLPYR